jgi:hypothetical protein
VADLAEIGRGQAPVAGELVLGRIGRQGLAPSRARYPRRTVSRRH